MEREGSGRAVGMSTGIAASLWWAGTDDCCCESHSQVGNLVSVASGGGLGFCRVLKTPFRYDEYLPWSKLSYTEAQLETANIY